MDTRYIRNRIYLDEKEQHSIKDCPVVLAGSGIGSVIAECALRLGFENITIIDYDHVELSNLNRQNYTESDLRLKKVEALKSRLNSINSNAKITVHDAYLNENNIGQLIDDHKIAVNALDFDSCAPTAFDDICRSKGLYVLHPYNLGWGGLLTIISPKGTTFDILKKLESDFDELNMVEYAASYLRFWGEPQEWLEDIIARYKNEDKGISPPQLSIGSWLTASMCAHAMFNICTGKEFKIFPEFYLSTMMSN